MEFNIYDSSGVIITYVMFSSGFPWGSKFNIGSCEFVLDSKDNKYKTEQDAKLMFKDKRE